MLHHTRGDVLCADVESLVNPVNTVGVMGKGIALLFKKAFPENFVQYQAACNRGEVRTGSVFVHELEPSLTGGPRWILNFPTKEHWRRPSRTVWIEEGLKDLRRVIEERNIASVAVPALGCGLGGLEWTDVRKLIEEYLVDLEGTDVFIYEPMRSQVSQDQIEGSDV